MEVQVYYLCLIINQSEEKQALLLQFSKQQTCYYLTLIDKDITKYLDNILETYNELEIFFL